MSGETGEFTQGLEGIDVGEAESVESMPDESGESVYDILMRPTGGYDLDDSMVFTDAGWKAHLNRAIKGVMESEANVFTDLLAAGGKLAWAIYTGTFWEENQDTQSPAQPEQPVGEDITDDVVER